jgi:hypothetical protein
MFQCFWADGGCRADMKVGVKGDRGDKGPRGDKGDTGDKGPKGDAGAGSAWIQSQINDLQTDKMTRLQVREEAHDFVNTLKSELETTLHNMEAAMSNSITQNTGNIADIENRLKVPGALGEDGYYIDVCARRYNKNSCHESDGPYGPFYAPLGIVDGVTYCTLDGWTDGPPENRAGKLYGTNWACNWDASSNSCKPCTECCGVKLYCNIPVQTSRRPNGIFEPVLDGHCKDEMPRLVELLQ